jgi:hypothetical protein
MAQLPQLNVNYGSYLPQSYSQDLFNNVTAFDEQNQKEQQRQFMEGINSMGKTFTGSALRSGINSLLGPMDQRNQQLINNIAIQGAQTGAQEGEATTAFNRSNQQIQQQQGWQAQQAALERAQELQMFQAKLKQQADEYKKSNSFGNRLLGGLAGGLGGLMTVGASSLLGGLPSLFGGGQSSGNMGNQDSMLNLDSYNQGYTPSYAYNQGLGLPNYGQQNYNQGYNPNASVQGPLPSIMW